MNYTKFFLRLLIVALSISAAIGIFIFLFGDFGETEARLLATTLSIGGYSLTGLCCASIHHRSELRVFSIVGMLVSIIGFLLMVLAIWEISEVEEFWKAVFIFVVLAVAFAHISLLFMIRPKTPFIKYTKMATIASVSIVALMLAKSILTEFGEEEFYFRLLGVFGILAVLGTLTTFIMNKISD